MLAEYGKAFQSKFRTKNQYTQFMFEYLSLQCMRQVNVFSDEEEPSYYLPHHCVFKNSKQSSKTHVISDTSSKNTTGSLLNDALKVSPVVQYQDLMSIVRFRTFAYVLMIDIIKMYRQVLIHPTQTRLQRILWHSDFSLNDTYELNTYDTSSALFLVIKCLKDLAERFSSKFPIGSICIQRDFYINDLLTGTDTTQEINRLDKK